MLRLEDMYTKLYKAWLNEEAKSEIQPLPENFYSEVSSYLKSLRSEMKGLDEKSLKAKLKHQEIQKAYWLAKSLITKRFEKIVKTLFKEKKKINQNNLTVEEKLVYQHLDEAFKKMDEIVRRILEGKTLDLEEKTGKLILRFLKDTPSLVGLNLKTYGPFKAEDLASIPIKNVEKLIGYGIVKKVEV